MSRPPAPEPEPAGAAPPVRGATRGSVLCALVVLLLVAVLNLLGSTLDPVLEVAPAPATAASR